MGTAWVVATALYAAAAGGLAAAGDTRSPALLLAAVVVTLPCGMAALVGIYGVYGFIVTVSRALGAQVMSGNGWGPMWFVVLDETAIFVMFAAAAVGNVLLGRNFSQEFRDRRLRRRVPGRSGSGSGGA